VAILDLIIYTDEDFFVKILFIPLFQHFCHSYSEFAENMMVLVLFIILTWNTLDLKEKL